MSALEQMYQQVILDHSKRPHGKGLRALAAGPEGLVGESHQVNPTCGDEVTLRVGVAPGADGGLVVRELAWEGQGCSISQASISVMTGLVEGHSIAEVTELSEKFSALMASRGKGLDSEEDEDLLGDATAFTGTSKFPARIKCALLGWAALKDSLARTGALAS